MGSKGSKQKQCPRGCVPVQQNYPMAPAFQQHMPCPQPMPMVKYS